VGAALPVAIDEQRGVERVDIVRCELGQRPPSERRYDVKVDVAPVGVVGAGPNPGLLDRQPPLGQVLAQGELLGRYGLAIVATLDLFCEDLLGVAAPRSRRDPTTPLLPSARVDTVVDDGVVAIALLLDASAHDGVSSDLDSERDATQYPGLASDV